MPYFLLILALSFAASAAPAPKTAEKPLPKRAAYSAAKRYRNVVRENHKAFERCGRAEVERTKRNVKGIVLIRFVVNGDGRVTESGPVHNTTKSRFIADCLVRNIEQLKFPASAGAPVTASYPFKFDLKK